MRFPWQKQKEFFTADERQQLVAAIQNAEQRTSGEVRLFVESRCRFMNAVDRAQELFVKLQMDKIELRNATLVYLAIEDKQAAVFGDAGIHQKVGEDYWKDVVEKMLHQFKQEKLLDGMCTAIAQLGEALTASFPYNKDTDKNELPDEIVFGR